jgi:hypothetical protein
MTQLQQLVRQYEDLDWRTAVQAAPSDRQGSMLRQWRALWRKSLREVPNFFNFVPAPGLDSAEGTSQSGTARSPGPALAGCASISCANMAGLSERSVRTYVCGGCMRERYCSRACQRSAHALHKQQCRVE